MKFSAIVTGASVLFSGAAAFGPNGPKPESEPTIAENFTWTDPFASRSKLARFDAACDAEGVFKAREYLLFDLHAPPPAGLHPYAEALKKVFSPRPYPGGWGGWDPHGYHRPLLKMEYTELPLAVRSWIEHQEKTGGKWKGLFAVYDRPIGEDATAGDTVDMADNEEKLRALDGGRVVIFAPGVLYEILPLWVAEGSECQEALSDLGKYSNKLMDGGVVAWVSRHTAADRGDPKDPKRDMEFTIKARVLKDKDAERDDDVKADTRYEL